MSHDTYSHGVVPLGVAPVQGRPAAEQAAPPQEQAAPQAPPAAAGGLQEPVAAVLPAVAPAAPPAPPAVPPRDPFGRVQEGNAAEVLGRLVREAPAANVISLHLSLWGAPYISVQLHGVDAMARLVAWHEQYGDETLISHTDYGFAVYSELNTLVDGVPVQVWSQAEVQTVEAQS
jgi:hypothetical protein